MSMEKGDAHWTQTQACALTSDHNLHGFEGKKQMNQSINKFKCEVIRIVLVKKLYLYSSPTSMIKCL